MEDFKELIKANYRKKVCTCVEGGVIFFDPESLKEIAGTKNMTYDEYLDIQIRSLGKYRSTFEMCYFNIPMGFKGQIEKMAKKHVCFRRIYIEGMYNDGTGVMFEGKEDHVWMNQTGFESFQIGDCVGFSAEIYRYLKTGNGKFIDYSLRNPKCIKKIAAYNLPSDDELIRQEIRQIICETCFFEKKCNRAFCMRDPKKLKKLQKQIFEMIKSN
ncbi:MAG: hypothetical protein K2N26_03290 [Oscillospiraceae bacterium]|nr:hypothetical protein [Oscillospiraceae bacterium]